MAEFHRLVEARGAALRQRSRQELLAAGNRPVEHVSVQGRPATIGVIVQPRPDGSLRVVVQGFLPCRLFGLLPFGSNVAIDGFYQRPDGGVDAMPDEELQEFD